MDVFVIDKEVIEIINNVNKGNHNVNLIELNDGRFITPTKVINSRYYEYVKNYLGNCEVITIDVSDIKNNQVIIIKKIEDGIRNV